MEFEVLKKSHLKRNIIIGVLVVGVIAAMILNFTRAKYRVTQSIPLVNGTINYSPGDIIISAYFNDELMETFPTKEDGYTVSNITCDNNATATLNEDTWEIEVTNLVTKGTKCDITFVEFKTLSETILAEKSLATRTDFTTTLREDTTGTIYYADTSKGRTYYFAGSPTDNWVQFGGFYWRIIRINEDGTIRMIYQGTADNTTGSGTQIGTSAFNSSDNNNMYVGYMYTSGQVHGLGTNSTIKGVLDQWYQNNLTGVSDKIDGNVGFCGDRSPYIRSGSYSNYTYTPGGGTGTTTTWYGALTRLGSGNAADVSPTFECENESDLYTTSGSIQGNGALTYPIGLITTDEVAYAGGVYGSTNASYYLYTNQNYWTMSPSYFGGSLADVFDVYSTGAIGSDWGVNSAYGVRPVINLKAKVTISGGDGSSTNPYVIV